MIFLIAVFIAIGVIVFFHYLQGFFSATISAVLAAVAALLALSLYEPAVKLLLGGKMANYAHGMVLLVLFALFYLVGRVLFDKMVPGNVRMPSLIDKIGGGAMGLVAAVFGVGIVAIAAQSFPFMPDVAGYTKYAVGENRPVVVPSVGGRRSSTDSIIIDEVASDEPGKFDEAKRNPIPILPVDDIVVGLLRQHSTIGALSANNPLNEYHPDLLQEYFGQRLGIQTGAPHVIVHNPAKGLDAIKGVELFHLNSLPQVSDYFYSGTRPPDWKKKDFSKELRPKQNQVLVVARVRFGRSAGDGKRFIMRFSPGSVRLVAGRTGPTGEMERANYFPIGTVDNANKLVVNRIDDFLFANVGDDRAIDFAFLVERDGLVGKGSTPAAPAARAGAGPATAAAAAAAPMTVAEDVFIEVNRMGTFDLSQAQLLPPSQYKAEKSVELMRPIAEPAAQNAAPQQAAVPLRDKLIGTWTGKATNGADLSLTFNGDGTVAYTVAGKPGTGTWTSQGEVNATTLNITRKLGEAEEETTSIVFNGDDNIALTNAAGVTTNLARKK